MGRPDEEQADFKAEEPILQALGSFGPPRFRESFRERLARLYRQRSERMDRILDVQRDIMAIEQILGG